MKVFIKGKGEITLSDNDYIAEGGAGKVYGKQGLAFKIYLDPDNMIPLPKFKELSAIKNDRIVRPLDILQDPKTNKPIGFTMILLDNSHTTPLAQLFTLGFRRKYGIQPDDMLKLVQDLRQTYDDVHAAQCLVIDGNEFSFKVDNQMTKVYVLDVDSFQTPSYPATFQMESIKDWHTQGYNQNTDWFAWGVVSFQMMIGIHPYRGFHKIHKDHFQDRMQRNLSVFDKDVDLPPSVLPFTVVPPTLLAWYKAVFQDGKRMPPPADFVGGAIVITADIRHISGTDKFEIVLVDTAMADLVEFLSVGGVRVMLTTDVTKKYPGAVYVGIGPKLGRVVYAYIDNGLGKLVMQNGQPLSVNIAADQMMAHDGRVYYKNGPAVYQLDIHETPTNTLASPRLVANVHELNTRLFEGVAIMSLVGTPHLVVFPEPNISYTIPVKEIKGQIVDAKYDNRIAMVVMADSKGKYHRLVLRFAKDFKSYEVVQTVNDITFTGLNFVTLTKGICANINEKNEVELFTNVMGNAMMKVIADPMIKSDMRLTKDGDQVLFTKGKQLYSLKMK